MPTYTANELPSSARMEYEKYLNSRRTSVDYEMEAKEHRSNFERIMSTHATQHGIIQHGKTMLEFYYGFSELVINVVPYKAPTAKEPKVKPAKPKVHW